MKKGIVRQVGYLQRLPLSVFSSVYIPSLIWLSFNTFWNRIGDQSFEVVTVIMMPCSLGHIQGDSRGEVSILRE